MASRGRTSIPVTDPKAWLALAHPLRLRILYHLAMVDAARATDLGRALDAAPNSVSFHLRQLARFGYVERDDSPRADRRERWWRSTSPAGFRIEGAERDPEAASQLAEVMRRRAHQQVDDWFDVVTIPDEAWDVPLRTSNYDLHLLLTPDDREQLLEELRRVFERWMEVSRAGEAEGREEFFMFGYGVQQHAIDALKSRRTSE